MDKWKVRNGLIDLSNGPLVMGILNVTPDSFSDGGDHNELDAALKTAEKMVRDGSVIIDVGGESTRPGADIVSEQEEIERVVPVIEGIASNLEVWISVDTYKAATAREALKAGAHIVNDVFGFQKETDIATAVKDYEAGAVLMANATMNNGADILKFKDDFLSTSLEIAHQAGITDDMILLDPGVGFGTDRDEDLKLMRALGNEDNILLGVSRKRIVDHLLGGGTLPKERAAGSVGIALAAAAKGVKVVRVHDVRQTVDALKTYKAVMEV